MSSPIASNAGRARSKSSDSPPTMTVSVPSSAFGREPVTGASRNPAPRSARSRSAIARDADGAMVDMSAARSTITSASAAPSDPNRTSSTCGASGTIVIVSWAPAAAPAGVAATRASCSAANSSARSRVRFHTVTWKPARTRLAAIGRPMIPSPRNAIRSIAAMSATSGRLDP